MAHREMLPEFTTTLIEENVFSLYYPLYLAYTIRCIWPILSHRNLHTDFRLIAVDLVSLE